MDRSRTLNDQIIQDRIAKGKTKVEISEREGDNGKWKCGNYCEEREEEGGGGEWGGICCCQL